MPQVAYAIAHSPLVKTAFFASDPNLGRILAAVGNAGMPTRHRQGHLHLDESWWRSAAAAIRRYREEQGEAAMKKPEITVRAVLNRGKAERHRLDLRLSYDYVKINAEYRT